jgi:signal peptidase I
MKPVVRYLLLFALLFATVLLIRLLFISSFRITGMYIGGTLHAGDCILVNKLKSKKNPGRNRLVFYWSPLRRDAAKPPIFVGRCIGIPGDVIRMGVSGFQVNGRLLPNAPMMQPAFRIHKSIKEPLLNTLDALRIPLRDITEDSVGITLRMSADEKELLLRNLSKVVPIEMLDVQPMSHEFVIPCKGKTLDIDATMLMVCREAILSEMGDAAHIQDGKLYIHGTEKKSYPFRRDYFWIISENETGGIDSRHLGLIPKDQIIGNACYCWFSKNPARRFKKIN